MRLQRAMRSIDQINGKLHRGSRVSRPPLYPNTQTARPWSTSTSSTRQQASPTSTKPGATDATEASQPAIDQTNGKLHRGRRLRRPPALSNTQTSRPWSTSTSSTRQQPSPTSTKPGTTDETKPANDQTNGKLHRGSRLRRPPALSNTQTSRPWSTSTSSTRQQPSPTSTKPGTTDETKPANDQTNGKLHRGSRLRRPPALSNTQTSRPWSTSTSSTRERASPTSNKPGTTDETKPANDQTNGKLHRGRRLRRPPALSNTQTSRPWSTSTSSTRQRPSPTSTKPGTTDETKPANDQTNGKLHRGSRLRRPPALSNTQTSRPWSTSTSSTRERASPTSTKPGTTDETGKLHRGSRVSRPPASQTLVDQSSTR